MMIGYRGYINMENVGDDLLYLVDSKLFEEEDIRLIPFSKCKKECSHEIAFFGGGTILPLWISREAKRWGISPNMKLVFFGAGVRDATFFNDALLDIRGTTYYPLVKKVFCKKIPSHIITGYLNEIQSITGICSPRILFKDFDTLKRYDILFLGVRGPRSKMMLKQHGIISRTIGDPVLALGKVYGIKNTSQELLLINIGGDGKSYPGQFRAMFQAVKQGTKIAHELDLKAVIVPFSYTDLRKAIVIRKLTRSHVPILQPASRFSSKKYIRKVIETYTRAGLVVGMRLHSLILSASLGIPFIPLAYRPKVLDFVLSLGFDYPVLFPQDVRGDFEEQLLDTAHRVMNTRTRDIIKRFSKHYTKKLKSSSKIVSDILYENLR